MSYLQILGRVACRVGLVAVVGCASNSDNDKWNMYYAEHGFRSGSNLFCTPDIDVAVLNVSLSAQGRYITRKDYLPEVEALIKQYMGLNTVTRRQALEAMDDPFTDPFVKNMTPTQSLEICNGRLNKVITTNKIHAFRERISRQKSGD